MKTTIAALAALAVLAPARLAGQQVEVTLAEAVRRALDVQPAVVQARGTQRNAEAGQRAAVGAFLPTITLGGGSNKSSSNRYNQQTGQIVTVPNNTSYSGSVGVSLDLFDGFRRIANKRAAAAIEDAADAGFVDARFQTTVATQQAFYAALANEELVRVADAQVTRAEQQRRVTVDKLNAGSATRSDTLRAAVDLGNARLQLLQAQANLATAQANLGRQIGVDQPVRALPDTAFPALPDTATLRAEAVASAPQVQQAEAQARAAGAQVTAARAVYWPTFAASYSNSYSGVDSLSRLGLTPWATTQSYLNSWSLRFSLSWTLFNGFTREANQVSASVQRDVARAQAADARRQINAQVTQQVAALFTTYEQIGIAQTNLAAATEDLRVVSERYRVGAATILDLLTSQANLTQAGVNLVQTRFNYLVARAQLEALVGHAL
jgi:outer membrane protein